MCSVFANEWRHARTTPSFKSDNHQKCENNQLISVLPIISKIFEKELFRQPYGYLSEKSLLSKISTRLSCSPLNYLGIEMCDEWYENIASGKLHM